MNTRELRLTPDDLREKLIGSRREYVKYVSPIINLANRFAQATRPKHVGQLSDLIRECPDRDYEGWRDWYLNKYPSAIEEATKRVGLMLDKLRLAIDSIDEDTVHSWVTELVIEQTYVGLRVERAILEEAARRLAREFTPSSQEDESRGVDGYLDGKPVSVKPATYKTMDTLSETINARMIYYEKRTNGTVIADLSDLLAP